MQTTRIHPRRTVFILSLFFGLGLGIIQSILAVNVFSSSADGASDFWTSILLWIVSFFIIGIVTTPITGTFGRGTMTTFYSSLIAGFITFMASFINLIVMMQRSAHITYPSWEQGYATLGFIIIFFEFFCLWYSVMSFSLIFGSIGAGLYKAAQKIVNMAISAG